MALTIFSELITRFPTAESLVAWLRSDEGGRLIVREDWMSVDQPIVLIHYDKKKSNLDLPHVPYFRSVVWDMYRNRPVSVGPPRGRPLSELADDVVISGAQEFADGVMVNLFCDGEHGWRTATHTQIDSDVGFYSKHSFSQLFWEVFSDKGLDVNKLDPTKFYSFVLQHPEERVVIAPTYGIPNLWVVETGRVDAAGVVEWLPVEGVPTVKTHDLKTVGDVKARVAAWGRRFGHGWQGLVVMYGGQRYKMRSDAYVAAKKLRGNESNRPYLWLERWSAGELPAYLRLFPEEASQAESIVQKFKDCTKELHELYMRVYRKKELPLGQAPRKYRKLLWDAHKAGKGAYFKNLRDFMNEQDTARKLWLVNYELRFPADEAATDAEAAVKAHGVAEAEIEAAPEAAPNV